MPALVSDIRRDVKRRTLLTPLDPVVSSVARILEYVGPRLSPPPSSPTYVHIGESWQLKLPGGLPSARRLTSGSYEPEITGLIKSLVKSGMVVVDAGANVGYYTLLAASLIGDGGHVYAFEPDTAAFESLRENVVANRISGVTCVNAALGRASGQLPFIPSALEGGFISEKPIRSSEYQMVDVASLDEYMASQGWPRLDLIKLDIEGAESSALSGMSGVVTRNPNVRIIMEFNFITMRRAGSSPEQLSTILRGLGFRRALIIELNREISLSSPLPKSGLVYNLLIST